MAKVPWRVLQDAIKRRDGYRCRRCRSASRLSAHHIKPRSQGGSNDPRNLITLCYACHDWAELQTERGISWADMVAPPPKIDDEMRIWYLDKDGIVTALIVDGLDEAA